MFVLLRGALGGTSGSLGAISGALGTSLGVSWGLLEGLLDAPRGGSKEALRWHPRFLAHLPPHARHPPLKSATEPRIIKIRRALGPERVRSRKLDVAC